MKRAFLHTGVVLAATLLVVACGGERRAERPEGAGTPSRSSNKPITIKGSDTMVILGQRFAEEYMRQHPGVVIQVNGGGSGTGIAALINGTVDLAQSSRPMRDGERADVESRRNAKLTETPVALDALAVFVNSGNRVRELSIDQLAQIYTGKVTNWNQVGGANAPIVLYGRENSSGTYEYFKEHVLNKADFAPRTQTLQGTAAVINAVARDKNGIGYGGIAYASDVRAVSVKKDAATPAVEPNVSSVADGSYPISRKLYFYWVSTANPELQQFVQWVTTPEGQKLVENVGYFPLSTRPATAEQTTSR
jgi:phosphate transport system substrate-binding protein